MKHKDYIPVEPIVVDDNANDSEVEIIAVEYPASGIEPFVVDENADDIEVEVIADVEYLPDPPAEVIIELPDEENGAAGEEETAVENLSRVDETLALAEEMHAEEERRRQALDDIDNICLMTTVCLF